MIWPTLFPLNRLKKQKKKKRKEKEILYGHYMDAWKVETLTNLIIFKKIFVFSKYIFFDYFLEFFFLIFKIADMIN